MKKSYKIKGYILGPNSDIDKIIAEISEHPEMPLKLRAGLTGEDKIFAFNNSLKLIPCVQRILSETNLVELDLSIAHLSATDVETIFNNQKDNKLKKLNLANNSIGDKGASVMAEYLKNNSLEVLILDNNEIGSKGAKSLAEALGKNKTLKVLSLKRGMVNANLATSSNNIGDEGLGDIIQSLKTNTQLEQLYCDNNRISFENFSFSPLPARINIKILSLNYNNINKNGLFNFCKILDVSVVEGLYLNHNPLGGTGAELIATSLKRNNSIKLLELNAAGIKDEDFTQLTKVLPDLPTLRHLNIGKNEITSDVINEFITNSITKTTIVSLNVSDIKLDEKAVSNIITLLKSQSLYSLYVSNTGITKEHLQEICNAIKFNKNLFAIDLSNNKLGPNLDEICKALKVNKSLTMLLAGGENIDPQSMREFNEKIEFYTDRNKSYAKMLAKFILSNKEQLCKKELPELVVPPYLLESGEHPVFPVPQDPVNFFSLFFSVNKQFLGKCVEQIDTKASKGLILNFHQYIAGRFFHIAGICKEFQGGILSTLPQEALIKIIIDYDIKLPCGPDFRVPSDIICSGDSIKSGTDEG